MWYIKGGRRREETGRRGERREGKGWERRRRKGRRREKEEKKILPLATTRLNMEDIMLSKISQTQKDK